MTAQHPQHLVSAHLISAVIVNYRSWDKLEACLDSLLNAQLTASKLEVIVVDNCSNDQQFKKFCGQYPTINFILNQGNFGFANGCNTGAKAAQGDYLFFVNPDTQVPNNTLEQLKSAIQELPSYSIVATQKLGSNNKYERVERFFPRWYTLTGLGKALHRRLIANQLKIDFALEKSIVYPEWVSGSVIFIRRHDFEKLGGWNEQFWMYSEDVDLCKRASNLGGKIALLQNVEIIHNHGGSSRINPVTAALTKSEVYISRHVYLSVHHRGNWLYIIQTLLAAKSLLKTAVIALFSLLALNHPKAKVSRILFHNLLGYYANAAWHKTWLSPRSRQHKHAS